MNDENCCHSENPIKNNMLVNSSIVWHGRDLVELSLIKKKKEDQRGIKWLGSDLGLKRVHLLFETGLDALLQCECK